MAQLRRLVLDILKPHEPNIIQLAMHLSDLAGVKAVNINIFEIDLKVENAKVTIEGDDIPYDTVKRTIEELAGTVHSIDEVVAGAAIIDPAPTLQG